MACESLQQRIDREGPLETLDVLRIGHQVACGLAAAHAQGLVHRDVKPANILLERGVDRVLLTDFGLARAADDASLTRTGVIAGTPQFMSPEQARGEAVDARSDLFCLGSVMYVLCAGRPPFRAETSYGVLRRITDEEPRSLRELNTAIPDWLAGIVARLHSKDPADRFQSAEEFAELLQQCLAHVQQPTSVPLPGAAQDCCRNPTRQRGERPGAPRLRVGLRHPRRVVAAGLLAACVAVGLLFNPDYDNTSRDSDAIAPPGDLYTAAADKAAERPTTGAHETPSASQPVSVSESWDDQAGSEIAELQVATEDLEARSRKLWSIRPTGTLIPSNENSQNNTSDKTTATPSSSRETSE